MSKIMLNDLLLQNVNTWGNVEYNIPLRSSDNETRTSTSIGLRHIPPIPHNLDCKINDPLPETLTGRDMVVANETYKTTSGEYCVKPNPNKANERADCGINCRRVIYMTGVEKKLQMKNIIEPVMISEMKDSFRGIRKSPITPQDPVIKAPDPEYIFNVVASGRNEAPIIQETMGGYQRLLDPYYTTYRKYHRPFDRSDQLGIGAKDHITYYSESNISRVKGFGPKFKELWMPLHSKPYRSVYDRVQFKKEFKEVAACRNPVNWLKGAFKTETKSKYTDPFNKNRLASWGHGESFDLAPFQPNPYQTNMAPFMYCTEYCHIGQGTSPNTVVNQINYVKSHKPCDKRINVAKDFKL